jgi:hypothetical protein
MAPHGLPTNGMRRVDSVLNLVGNNYQTLLIARMIVGFFPIPDEEILRTWITMSYLKSTIFKPS